MSNNKQQFCIYLSPEVGRQLKELAEIYGEKISPCVARIISEHYVVSKLGDKPKLN